MQPATDSVPGTVADEGKKRGEDEDQIYFLNQI